jgi:flagellar hook-basal body complex protein FliE
MSQMDVNSLLTQMRQLSTQISSTPAETSFASAPTTNPGVDFSSLLKQSVASVAQQQNDAQTQVDAFERGDPGADIGKTQIAGQKADLAFRSLVAVRNKLTDAYTNIMNMPV